MWKSQECQGSIWKLCNNLDPGKKVLKPCDNAVVLNLGRIPRLWFSKWGLLHFTNRFVQVKNPEPRTQNPDPDPDPDPDPEPMNPEIEPEINLRLKRKCPGVQGRLGQSASSSSPPSPEPQLETVVAVSGTRWPKCGHIWHIFVK